VIAAGGVMASANPILQPQVSSSDVYKQRCDDHRFYQEMRFKQLTLWSGATALLLNAEFSDKSGAQIARHPLIIPVIGLLFTAAFWVMEVRSTLHGIEALEATDPYKELLPSTRLARWNVVNHTLGTLALYFGSFLIWSRVAVTSTEGTPAWVFVIAISMMLIVLASLIVFSVREYIHVWKNTKGRWRQL
jgi:hypothetical protein